MKVYKYYNDTYPVVLHLAVYDEKEDIKEVQNEMCNLYHRDLELNPKHAAETFSMESCDKGMFTILIIYFGKDNLTLQNILHESYHALDFYITYLGLDNKSSYDISNEHLAYFQGWIGLMHQCLIDELKQNKKKTKK